MQFKASDKEELEETKKLLAEKEQMNDIAAQLGKSLLNKIEEYEQQVFVLQQRIEEDEKQLTEYQSETAVWKEKYAILAEKMLIVESHNVRLEEQLEDLHSKHKSEREKVKPLLMRNRSLRSNLSDLELLKDEVASFQAAENNYRRQAEILMKKNSDLEKEIEHLKNQLDSVGDMQGTLTVKYRPKPILEKHDESEDVMLRELGVSVGEIVSLLGRLLGKMAQVEQDSFEYGNTLLVLDKAGKWIEYMQTSAQPIIFQSLSAKLIDSGIKINTNRKDSYVDGMQSTLQLSTLLLTCLVSLQLCIDSTAIHDQNVREWKRRLLEADHELQELRIRTRAMEGETIIFQTQIEELKHEVKHASEREERDVERRRAMVHVAVNTDTLETEEKETNTQTTQLQHKETSTERAELQEVGINTESEQEIVTGNLIHVEPGTETITQKSNSNLIHAGRGTETASDESSTHLLLAGRGAETISNGLSTNLVHAEHGTETLADGASENLLHAEPVALHATQEIELLRKEVLSLKEELRLNNIPSQRVTSVTTWEKNYQSILQGPLLRYINAHLHGHPRLAHVLPANPDRHINRATFDGVLLCILVSTASPGILDERVINFVPTSDLEVIQNFTLTINTAMAVGCIVPTTNPELLLSNPHLMLEMLYQLVRCELLGNINVVQHPALVRLRKDTESPAKFRSTAPSELLQRWTNFHVQTKSTSINISSQTLSEELFRALFSAISRPSEPLPEEQDWLVSLALQAGVKSPPFLDSTTIGNAALQFLFLAQVAHAAPGLAQLSEIEMKRETEDERDPDPQGTREERAFVMWINGLGIPVFVTNLQYDMNDGLVLLHTLDKIERGVIHWKEVNTNPNNAYKKVENCNLGLKVCVSKLNFSLVGIGGKDIVDGNRKFILAVIWQACKYHLLAALRTCGDGVEVTESDVLSFLNKRISQPISSFKDHSLRTALPLLDLLLHLAPEVVKQDNIRRRFPISPEDCLLNAKYAIGLARKIFVLPPSSPASIQNLPLPSQQHSPRDIPLCLPILPEDIVEVNPKMLFIFVAMMMLVDKISPKKPAS